MKFYSRKQMIIAIIVAVLLSFFLGASLKDQIQKLGSASDKAETQTENQMRSPEATLSADNESFTLETNHNYTRNVENLPNLGQGERENIDVYEKVNESVVNITTETIAYNWFLEAVPREGGSGSGSIIDKRGYVLTNNHVVRNAYKVYITLSSGSEFEGKVIGVDPENDLAVIQFDPKDEVLITIPFGSSDSLKVGRKVLAIGNPFGLNRTMTTGIISSMGRSVKSDNGLIIRDLIQTDASINPGNSGGPLLNSRGEMIGINTMIYSPSGGSVGIGFAVPIDTAKRIISDLIKFGKVLRGWIDIDPVQLFPALVRYADLPVSRGILVSRTIPGGNAEKAGIRGGSRNRVVRSRRNVIYLGGDIIVAVDGEKIETLADLYIALEDNKPGDRIQVSLYRGRKKIKLELTLSERPDNFQWE